MSGITVRGPFYQCGGYADECVSTVTALKNLGLLVRTEPVALTSDSAHVLDPRSRKLLTRLCSLPEEHYDEVLLHFGEGRYASKEDHGRYRTYIFRTTFETDALPKSWLKPLSQADEVWVPSSFNKTIFIQSGLPEDKVYILPEGVDTDLYTPKSRKMILKGTREFKILSIFKWEDRKGIDILLAAYLRAFTKNDDVTLILKVTAPDTHAGIMENRLAAVISDLGYRPGNHAHVMLMTGVMSKKKLARLYASVDVFALLSRGEGCGRPYMEALSSQLPVIATRWSGQLDYLNDENAFLVEIEKIEPVMSTVDFGQFKGHRWALPSVEHAIQLLRRVREDGNESARRAQRGRHDAINSFDMQKVAERWKYELQRVLEARL